MMLFHKTLLPLYALVFVPIFPSLMFEMCENYVHSSAQAFNFANEIIMMMQPSIDVDFVVGTANREMEPAVSPSFAPPVADYSAESVDLGYCVKTLKQEMEPVIMSLTSELFDAVSSNFELVRKNLEAFTNKLPSAADLFAIINTKLKPIGELAMIHANDLMSLTSELFDAVSSNFKLVRKDLEAFTNKLPSAADLFASINTKLEHIYEMIQVNDLFDIIASTFERFHQYFSDHYEAMDITIRAKYEELFSGSYEVIVQFFSDPYEIIGHGTIPFSSAPMVTGNLTGSAINLGRIDYDSMLELIPTTGCTIPVFSLDFILELTDREVFIKSFSKQEGNVSSSFILESLDRSWAVLESIVSRVLDRISLGYQQVSEKLESLYKQHFAPTTTTTPSSWVGELVITACKKWAVLESIASSLLDRISLWYQQVSEKLESLYKQHFAPATRPPPPSSWVGELVIMACKKLGAFVTDFFAPTPPPRNFQLIARKFLSTIRFDNMLTWHAINRNRGGIQ